MLLEAGFNLKLLNNVEDLEKIKDVYFEVTPYKDTWLLVKIMKDKKRIDCKGLGRLPDGIYREIIKYAI